MQIQIDTREHKSELDRIMAQFDRLGVTYFKSKLFVGDYMSLDNPRLVIDRKKDLQEICGNVTRSHERFKKELMRAKEQGIKIIILIEHGQGVETLEDVFFWKNPRRTDHRWNTVNGKRKFVYIPEHKRATNGDRLYKCLCTIRDRYGVQFEFCRKDETGKRIIELLGGNIERI